MQREQRLAELMGAARQVRQPRHQPVGKRHRHEQEEDAEMQGTPVARAGRGQEHGRAGEYRDVGDRDDVGEGARLQPVPVRQDQRGGRENLGDRSDHHEDGEGIDAAARPRLRNARWRRVTATHAGTVT